MQRGARQRGMGSLPAGEHRAERAAVQERASSPQPLIPTHPPTRPPTHSPAAVFQEYVQVGLRLLRRQRHVQSVLGVARPAQHLSKRSRWVSAGKEGRTGASSLPTCVKVIRLPATPGGP